MKKILIVDDSKTLIGALQKGLTKYSDRFEPVFAMNGLEAMTILEAEPVSLVVTDIQMPVVDGLVLLAFIRERFPDMPCIIMSSYCNADIKAEIGGDVLHFIDKPLHLRQFVEIITQTLEKADGKGEKSRDSHSRVPIGDLLNLIILGRKTCIFKIIPDKGSTGFFYFYQGELYSAVYGKHKGLDALAEALQHNKAQLVFTKPPDQKGQKMVQADQVQIIQLARNAPLAVKVVNDTLIQQPVQP